MKKTLKGPATVFFILALSFAIGWIAIFMLHGLLAKDQLFEFDYFYNKWLLLKLDQVKDFVMDPSKYGLMNYICFGGVGVIVVLMIVGLILTIVWKRKRYIPFGLVMAVAGVAIFDFTLDFERYYKQYISFDFSDTNKNGNIAFTLATLVVGGLLIIFVLIEYFVGLARAKRLCAACECEEKESNEVPSEEKPEEAEQPAQDVNELFATAPATEESFAAAVPVEEEKSDEYDTMADFAAEPEEQVAQPEEIVVEEVPEQKDAITRDDLASILKDVVRDIVRDEIARANAAREEEAHPRTHRDGDHSITGATFGGPLVVQYFNGGINGQDTAPCYTPAPAPAPVVVSTPAPAPAPAPKKEEKKEEPAPAPVPVPAPVAEEKPAEEPAPEKNPIIRIPFTERMLDAEKDMQDNYNELKNEIMSYGVNSRVSNSGDTFRLHRKTYVKLTIAGKSLKLYFALDPKDYADSKMPIGDASQHAVYAEIPLIFKVKSGLSMRRAKELIRDVMSKDGLEQGEVGSVNWVKELKANAK